MAFQTYKLNNAHVIIDGVKSFGRASEIDLPTVAATMQEHAVLGLNAKFELPTAMEPMESVLRFNSIYPEFAGKMLDVFKAQTIQIRSSQEVFTGPSRTEERPFVIFLKATPKEQALGNFKQGEFEGNEVTLNVLYLKIVVNRVEVVEIDVLNNIYKINGEDKLANFRANLGL